MFYSQFILAKKGPLGTIWIAAHLERKLRRNQVAETNIGVTVDSILCPEVPIALRLSGHLLLGVVRIYSRQVNYLFNDCSETLGKIKHAINAVAVDLPPEETTAPFHTITLPETFDFDELELGPDAETSFLHLNGNYVDHHVSSREQITLQDCIENNPYLGSSQFGLDERFGDGDYASLNLDFDEDFLNGNLTEKASPPFSSPSKSIPCLKEDIIPLGNEAVCMDIDDPSEPLGLGPRNVDLNGQAGDHIDGQDQKNASVSATLSGSLNENAATKDVSKNDTMGFHAYTPDMPTSHAYTPSTPAFHAFTPRPLEACTPDLNQEYCPPDEPSTPALAEETSLPFYQEILVGRTGNSVSFLGEVSGRNTDLEPSPASLSLQQGFGTPNHPPSQGVPMQTVGSPKPPSFQGRALQQGASVELHREPGWAPSSQTVCAPNRSSFHGFPLQQVAPSEQNREQGWAASIKALGTAVNPSPFQGFSLQQPAPAELRSREECGVACTPMVGAPNPPPFLGFPLQAVAPMPSRDQGWATSTQTPSPKPPSSQGLALQQLESNGGHTWAASTQRVITSSHEVPLQQAIPAELNRELLLTQVMHNQAAMVEESAARTQSLIHPIHVPPSSGTVSHQGAVLPGGEPNSLFPPSQPFVASLCHQGSNLLANESFHLPASSNEESSLRLHGQRLDVALAGHVESVKLVAEATRDTHGLDAFPAIQHSAGQQGKVALATAMESSIGMGEREALRSTHSQQRVMSSHILVSDERIPALELYRDKLLPTSSDGMAKERVLLQLDKTPTLRDDFLSSAKFSGPPLDSLPGDDDVLASILGQRNNPFKVLPTPKALKPPKPSRPETLLKTPKSVLKKRKVEIDTFTVLHGDVIRQQLANAEDIRRERCKAPCTRREVWRFIRANEGLEKFEEPTLSGLPSDLHDLYHDLFNDFESKPWTPAFSGVLKGEQAIESCIATCDARVEIDPLISRVNEGPNDVEQEVSGRPGNSLGDSIEQLNQDMEIDDTTEQSEETMRRHNSVQLNEIVPIDSAAEQPKQDIHIDSYTELLKEDMQIDNAIGQPKKDMQIDSYIEQPKEGVAEQPREGLQGETLQAVSSTISGGAVRNPDTSMELQDGSDASKLVDPTNGDACEQAAEQQNIQSAIEQVLKHQDARSVVELNGAGQGEENVTICSAPENLVSIVGAAVEQDGVAKDPETFEEQQYHSSAFPVEVPSGATDGTEIPISQATGTSISQAIDMDQGHVEDSERVPSSNGLHANEISCGDDQDTGGLGNERDTGFLDDDNDDVVYAEIDYSGDEQSAPIADDHGWSVRSRNVGRYLKIVFEEMESSSKELEAAEHPTLGLDFLLARKTRREAARMFFETLVLKTKDYIHVEQNMAYADVHVYPKPKLMKMDF